MNAPRAQAIQAREGRKTSNELLNAEERIASNIFSDRLRRLEASGIVVRQRDTEDGRRATYRLTDKGMGLAPTPVEPIIWSAGHGRTDVPPTVIEEMVLGRKGFIAQVRLDWVAAGKALKAT